MLNTIITKQWLIDELAYEGLIIWWEENINNDVTAKELIYKLISGGKYKYANWLLMQFMDKRQEIQYDIFSVEKALYVFENKYPDDKRPRKYIEEAKLYLNCNSEKNAIEAIDAVYAIYAEANANTDVHSSAVTAIDNDSNNYPSGKVIYEKILKYGIELLTNKED